jgi:arylsulfatase
VNVPFSYSGNDGVLVAQGGASEGYALWIKDGIPQWTVNRSDESVTISGSAQLSPGRHTLKVVQDKKGIAQLKLDGTEIAKGSVGGAFVVQPHDSLSVGVDSGSPVTEYGKSNRYPDEIGPVAIELKR